MSTQYESEVSLGQAIFGNTPLGDRRRTMRLVETFDLMQRHPGGTLPDKFASPADLRAFYRLCDCDDVTHAAVIGAMRRHTFTQIAACDGPVLTFDDARRVIGWYERRWIVEELHKAKKTGCQIEDMQFTTLGRLEPAIALLSVVAITLLNLRDASRRPDAKTRLATTVVAPDYVDVPRLCGCAECLALPRSSSTDGA